jgi:hypothetical protein
MKDQQPPADLADLRRMWDERRAKAARFCDGSIGEA